MRALVVSVLLSSFLLSAASAEAQKGWDEANRRALQLIADGKMAEAIAIYERALAQAPDFDHAHFALAYAHQLLARQLALEGPGQNDARRRHWTLAATHFRHAADRAGDFQQGAWAGLMEVYDEDGLNLPQERIAAARHHIKVSPRSAIGHLTLANTLRTTGQASAALTALNDARTAVRPEDAILLATGILDHLTEAPAITSPALLGALLDYAEGTIDRERKRDGGSRPLLLSKVAAVKLRAERLERDPARKKALEAEAEQLFGRYRATARPASVNPPPAPVAAASLEPPGYDAARTEAEALIERKQFVQAAAIYETFTKSHPQFLQPHYFRLRALTLAGQSQAIEPALKAARSAVPATPESRYSAGVHLWDVVRSNKAIAAPDAKRLLDEAVAVLDEALTLKPTYFEAVAYKSVVLRTRASFETDPQVSKRLLAEADRLLAEAQAMRPKP